MDLGYKGQYDLGMNDEPDYGTSSGKSYNGPYSIGNVNLEGPYKFGDIGKGFMERWKGFEASEPDESQGDPYGLRGSLPGSFKTDVIRSDEFPAMTGEGYAPKGTFEGINKDGEAVSINPSMRPDYFVKGWRPEGAQMMSDEELKKTQEAAKQQKEQRRNNRANKAADYILTGLSAVNNAMEKRIARQQQEQLDQNIWERQMTSAGNTDKGMYLTNSGVPVTPVQQTPVQFTGYNPNVFAKKGAEVGSKIAYLTDAEIKAIIQMGGQVEFLD